MRMMSVVLSMVIASFFCLTSVSVSDSSIDRAFHILQSASDLADLLLTFPGFLFVFASGFQLGIHTKFAGDLLELTLRFVKIAFRLVLRVGFHGILPNGIWFD